MPDEPRLCPYESVPRLPPPTYSHGALPPAPPPSAFTLGLELDNCTICPVDTTVTYWGTTKEVVPGAITLNTATIPVALVGA